MKKKQILTTIFLFFLTSFSFSKNLDNFYLELNLNNLDIQKSRSDYQLSKLNYKSSFISQNPDFSMSIYDSKTQNLTNNSNYSIGITYNLDLWNKLKDNQKSKLIQTEMAKLSLIDIKNSTIMKFNDYYLQLAYTNQKIEIENQKIIKYNEKLKILNSKFNNDYILQDQLFLIKNNILSIENNINSLKDTKNTLINNLNTLLNKKSNDNFDEPTQLNNLIKLNNFDSNFLHLIQNNATVQSAFLNITSYDYMVIYNQKSYYPTISLGGNLINSSFNIAKLFANPLWAISSSINFNLNLNEIQNNIEISKINKKQAEINYQNIYLNLYNNIYENLKKYENSLNSLTKSKENFEHYSDIVKLYSIQYEKGFLNYTNLLDEEIILLNSQEELISYDLTRQQIINKLNYFLLNKD